MRQDIKKIGRQVLFLETSSENCRNGEGAFVRLLDGGILFAYTEFQKGTGHDEDEGLIAGIISYDEGETWGEKRILVTKRPEALNIMGPNFLRLKDGSLALFHGEKYKDSNGIITNTRYMRVSHDEGKSWSEGVRCYKEAGYSVMNHDRALRLKSGRIILPIAHHSAVGFDMSTRLLEPGKVVFSVSDDEGKTWRTLDSVIRSPFSDPTGLQEPGLYQHEDGTLWMWCRTAYGCQYMACSTDDGETWSQLEPALYFSSPTSPMSVKKAGAYTVAIFNPIPRFCGRDESKGPWGRSPLVCAVSTDDGQSHDAKSFDRLFYLEDDINDSYCYAAIFPEKDYFLAAYYHSNGSGWCLNSTRVLKVDLKELS